MVTGKGSQHDSFFCFFFVFFFWVGELFITPTWTCNERNHKCQTEGHPQPKLQANLTTWVEADTKVCKEATCQAKQAAHKAVVHQPTAKPVHFQETKHHLCPNQPNIAVKITSIMSMASNARKGKVKCPGAKTTSHDGRAGHVMTRMCHPSKARRMASVTIQVPMQGVCTQATGIALWPAILPRQAMSTKHVVLEHGGHIHGHATKETTSVKRKAIQSRSCKLPSLLFFFVFFFLGYREDVHSMQAARATKIPDEPMLCETPALSR